MPFAGGSTSTVFLERFVEGERGETQRRKHPEQQSGGSCDRDCEPQGRAINADRIQERYPGAEFDKSSRTNDRQHPTEHGAGARQDQALGEHLPDQSPACGAKGRAYGDLLFTRRAANQQEVREIHAHDQHD